jgi:hypothetical protein
MMADLNQVEEEEMTVDLNQVEEEMGVSELLGNF